MAIKGSSHLATDSDIADPAQSPTAYLLDELALFGHRPHQDEPDYRLLPNAGACMAALNDAFEILSMMLAETRLEDDLAGLLRSFVNIFHRKIDRIQGDLDDNEAAQRRCQRDQDGSEVKSVELERMIAQGLTLIERRNAFEFMRDHAAELFETHTGSAWRPPAGSKVNHGTMGTMTAAVIDSRDYINAKRLAETEVLIPKGARILFTGGVQYQDHGRIWAALDKVRAKHPDMVLMHSGADRGAELIAARWAHHRSVPQVVFKPDWLRYHKAAPFKRNDAMLEAMPLGVIAFPGSGITDNLVDKAKALGIPVRRYGATA